MPIEFQMPKLGLTMEEGTILQWLVPDGAEVTAGTAVMVIETDKVETEVEATESGRLAHASAVGDTITCGERVGWFLAAGEEKPTLAVVAARAPEAATAASANAAPTAPASVPVAQVRGDGGRILASPNAKRIAAELRVDLSSVTGSGPGGRIVSEDVERAAAQRPVGAHAAGAAAWPSSASAVARSTGPVDATPAGWQLAQLLGIDLHTAGVSTLSGDGKIGREDVAEFARALIAKGQQASSTPTAAVTAPASVAPAAKTAFPLAQTPSSTVAMKGMRGTIASRMHASLQDMAQLTLTMDVEMDAVVADRNARKAAANGGAVPGYTDYVIAAAAKALQQHPYVNSQVTAEGVALLPQVNVGMAVALDNGLVVPVVHNTPTLSLEALGAETTRLAEAARKGGLKLTELEGGTFSVTALGMFGVDAFTPVINPPNTAILGVGRIRTDVAWVDGAAKPVQRLTLSLTWDHRAFDGAPAAEFARTIATLLQTP